MFSIESGDNYDIRQCAKACLIFDPMFLRGKRNEIATIKLLVDKLNHFHYKEFNSLFINEMKKKIPYVVKLADKAFDWDTIENSRNYVTRMQGRIK